MLTRRNALLSTLSLLACSRALAARDSYIFEYRGWHVDASRDSHEPRDAVVAAITRQLEIVENLGIAQDILGFMRTVPIWTDPSRREGGPAHYDRAKGVDIRVSELDSKKPIVLHELLHAFHEQKLGFDNAEIIRFFERARASGAWPTDARLMADAREFFAVTSTVYLFGSIDVPPFTQGQLHQAQPDYWTWLGVMFDGFRGCE
jgi:hypothetical protein